MAQALALVYGVLAYLVFFGTFLYSIYFVWMLQEPRAAGGSLAAAVVIDLFWLSAFAIQHSVMSRQWFKRAWTRIVPHAIERSTYVLIASLILLGMYTYWEPLPGVIWEIQAAWVKYLLIGVFALGWLIVLVSTCLIDHYELFGLRQVWSFARRLPFQPPAFRTPGLYRWLRHPIYFGFILAFWSAPRMTSDHLLFAVMTTVYMLLAIQFEERDLVKFHGEAYRTYQSGVSMITPWPKRRKERAE